MLARRWVFYRCRAFHGQRSGGVEDRRNPLSYSPGAIAAPHGEMRFDHISRRARKHDLNLLDRLRDVGALA
jgi:hypothetical protein